MKIELKKIEFYERMSEETNCFAADLYINGKKVGYVKNDGQGGQTDYRGYSKADNEVIAKAEAYCKTLPKVKYHTMEFEQSLEHVIDQLFEDYLKAKEQKKMLKLMQTSILYGVPNGLSYTKISWSNKTPLSAIPVNILQKTVDEIKAKHCTNGIVILNTNLQSLGINI